MALLYRKRIRDAMKGFLSDPSTGFNPRLVASASAFGVTAFSVDFTSSASFLESYLELDKQPEIIEQSLFMFSSDRPLCMALYTTDASDEGLPRGIRWNGEVIACVDLVSRYRQGAEGELSVPNTEDVLDAAESSVFLCLNEPSLQWPSGTRFTRQSAARRGGLWQLADGFQQVCHISFRFGASDV